MPETVDNVRSRYPGAETFTFGDNDALSEQLISLVREGRKTATTGAVRDYEAGEAYPVVGRRDIVLDFAGVPALVVETVELRRCTFSEVTEEMALAEGEDDDLAGWRAGHRRYFERTGGFDPDMPVIWERFSLVEDLRSQAV